MSKVVAYGLCVKNAAAKTVEVTKTIAWQEASQLNCREKVIDIVRAETSKRPKLQQLIDTLGLGDRIEMYSVDAFLCGTHTQARELYNRIIDKGIDLIIYDFDNAVPRITEFSTLRYKRDVEGKPEYDKSFQSPNQLKQCFADKLLFAKAARRCGTNWRVRPAEKEAAFRELYFAFESYQLTLPQCLDLLRKGLNIQNKITFYDMCRDYERSLNYEEDFAKYAKRNPEIQSQPKRLGRVPEFYGEIIKYAKTHPVSEGWKQSVENALCRYGYKCSYEIFHRWELLAEKKPRPRKPVAGEFNPEKLYHKLKK